MKKSTFKRILSLVMALTMVMSYAVMPAAATEESSEPTETSEPHQCSYGEYTVVKEATCGKAGTKTATCSVCEDVKEEEIPATNEHTYENGVCTACQQNKPCNKTADCDAPAHEADCLKQCTGELSCTNGAHKEDCLKIADCTCVAACGETKACRVCEAGGECDGAEAAQRIAAVQALIDALPTQYPAEQREAAFAQYQACTSAIEALIEAERNELDLTNYAKAAQPTVIASEVDTLEELKTALEKNADTINLNADITITGIENEDILVIDSATTINGNNHTITSSAPRAVNVDTTADVTIKDLKIVSNNKERGINIINKACNLTLNNVHISGVSHYAINFAGTVPSGSVLNIQNSSQAAGYGALNITNSGNTITIANSTLAGNNTYPKNESNDFAVIAFSSESATNNSITVTGGTLLASSTTGNKQAIVSGFGFGNTVNISESTTMTLEGTGAIYVLLGAEKNTFIMPGATAEILALRNQKLDSTGKVVNIINNESALSDAVAAGGTVTLEGDITLTKTLTIPADKTVTLNLNGKEITMTANNKDVRSLIENNGTLEIKGSGTLSLLHTDNQISANTITNQGTLTVSGVTINNTTASGICYAIDNNSGVRNTNLTVSNSTLVCKSSPYGDGLRLFTNSETNDNNVTITEGSVISSLWVQNPSDSDSSTKNTKDTKANVTISGGTVNALYIEPSSNFKISITGGEIATIGYYDHANTDASRLPSGFITGGTFSSVVSTMIAPGYKLEENGTVVAVEVETQKPVINVAPTVDPSIANDITDNVAVKNVNTGLDSVISKDDTDKAIQILSKDFGEEELADSTIQTTVSVNLTGVEKESSNVKTLVFDVKPIVQAVPNDSTKEPVSAVIPNDKLGGNTITFRLPIVGTTAGKYVSVTHNGTYIDLFQVQGTGNNLFIEIETKSFSPFVVTILSETAEPIAEVKVSEDNISFANINDAITYLNANGGNLKLLKDVNTSSAFNVASGKTVSVDLNSNTLKYTGDSAAFVNNGTLTVSGGTVTVENSSGTLAQNREGTMTISAITYRNGLTTGVAISVEKGTVNVSSGSFTGNAHSLKTTGDATATITGGTFNSPVEGKVTIYAGNYNAAVTTTVPIPGMVNNAANPARFKIAPSETSIEDHFSAVNVGTTTEPVYAIQKDYHMIINGAENFEYSSLESYLSTTPTPTDKTITLTKDEVINGNHTLDDVTIDLNGHKITTTATTPGSIRSAAGKTAVIKNIGNKVQVELKNGDAVSFTSTGAVNVNPIENTNSIGEGVTYGSVLLTFTNTNTLETSSTWYFVGINDDTQLSITRNGGVSYDEDKADVVTGFGNNSKFPYSITVNEESSDKNYFRIGSSKSMVVASNGFHQGLISVVVTSDGYEKELNSTHCTITRGSTVVTLKNSYLKTLSKGTYNIELTYKDGETIDANFIVAKAAKPASNPQTGDVILTSVVIMVVAAAALGVLVYMGKKKKK